MINITGGSPESAGLGQSSTELLTAQGWQDYIPLPHATRSHCLVKINTTHVLMADHHSYIFSNDQGFVRIADMIRPRDQAACALHGTNYVIVAGGTGPHPKGQWRQSVGYTTEVFSLQDMKWHQGPAFGPDGPYPDPPALYGGVMISEGENTFMFGEKKIFWLFTGAGSAGIDGWKWVLLQDHLKFRVYWDAFIVPSYNCSGGLQHID